jgi:hypothetical protein
MCEEDLAFYGPSPLILATISKAEINKSKDEKEVEIMSMRANGGDGGGGVSWSQFRLQGKILVFCNNSRSSGT